MPVQRKSPPAAGYLPQPFGTSGSWSYAGSWHTGGANFCFADGSVHFLVESTSTTVLNELAAMADGSVVSLP